MSRIEIKLPAFESALGMVRVALADAIEQHGRGAFTSKHEILGCIAEEYHELIEAVQRNDFWGDDGIITELEDLAVVSVFALASFSSMAVEGQDKSPDLIGG